jgi:hypothetical protein
MACSPRVSNKFVVLALAGSMLATVKCDSKPTTSNSPAVSFAFPLGVTPLVATSIVPTRLALTPLFGAGCLTFPSLTTRFDLVVVHGGTSDLFMREATIRLLDGTHLGGSSLVMSSADLTARFGSTLIVAGGRRTFRFDPQFGCGSFVPLSLGIDLLLLDPAGARHTASVSVPVDTAR